MSKNNLKEEIKSNVKDVLKKVFVILPILLKRYFLSYNKRTTDIVYTEYDDYWDTFWQKADIFRLDLPFVYFDKPTTNISPFLYKKNCILPILIEKIKSNEIDSVCEIGSGAGLNLILLATLFPDVKFFGIEPTESGVRITNKFIENPPREFGNTYKLGGKLRNIEVFKENILDTHTVKKLQNKFDFVFTCAVLEQLNNYIDIALYNSISLTNKYFLFFEEWFEANYLIDNYVTLVKSDYFRISWNYMNKFKNIEILEKSIPALQPAWLKYGVVFGKKIN